MAEENFNFLNEFISQGIEAASPLEIKGKVTQVVGTMVQAVVPGVRVGELCILRNPWEKWELKAEVVGFHKEAALLTPLGQMLGLSSSTEVIPLGKTHAVGVGPKLLGRVLDGLGQPMDTRTKGNLEIEAEYPVYAPPPDPLTRKPINKPMALGIRCLDSFLTCGEGQRMGIFAAAGCGKSTLLAQIIRCTEAEIIVLGLIGERGREVREFIEHDLGEEGLKKSVLVIATSDRPSMERLKAAFVATTIAEYFRDQGKKVLLMMDSVTRFARAQREIGLAAGEPPTRRGFPPSVFEALPRLMERAGQSDKGSITALYTVLVEGDDMTEPVADETRSILDGHIILSRKLGAANHFPAVAILDSVSRVMNNITTPDHRKAAARVRDLLSKYQEVELLLRIGEYQKGSDPDTDEAVQKIAKINTFLKQSLQEKANFQETLQQLSQLAAK